MPLLVPVWPASFGRTIAAVLTCAIVFGMKAASGAIQAKTFAIVGGGLAGMATAHKLLPFAKSITLFDVCTPGNGGASAASAGLMHPFAPSGKPIWNGFEGFEATKRLLKEVQSAHQQPLYQSLVRLIRPFRNAADLETWSRTAEMYPFWVDLLSKAELQRQMPQSEAIGAAVIKHALVVDCSQFLQAAWNQLETSGSCVEWRQARVDRIDELANDFDLVVLASGSDILRLWNSDIQGDAHGVTDRNFAKIKLVKGQNIHFQHDAITANRDFAVLMGEYLLPRQSYDSSNQRFDHYLVGGATHEHLSRHEYCETLDERYYTPQLQVAQRLIGDKLLQLDKSIESMNNTAGRSGIRVVTARSQLGRVPIVRQHDRHRNVYCVTGFGSRGLVHHALVCDQLVAALAAGDYALSTVPAALQQSFD